MRLTKIYSLIIIVSISSIGIFPPNMTYSKTINNVPSPQYTYTVEYMIDDPFLSSSIQNAISKSLDIWPGIPPKDNIFYLVDINWHEKWAIATLTTADLKKVPDIHQHTESYVDSSNLISLLLVKIDKNWEAAIDVDPQIRQLLNHITEKELPSTARNAIFPPVEQIRNPIYQKRQSSVNYKFPWPSGQAWQMTNGWHDGTIWGGIFPAYTSLDFDILGGNGANSDILAAASGTVTHRCTTNVDDQALIYITTDGTNEKMGYLHLSKSSLTVASGSHINQGQKIGRMASLDNGSGGTTPPSGSCAAQVNMRTHLHVYFPYKPITIDGYIFSSSNTHGGENLYSTQGQPTTSSCPASGGVILYKDINYKCAGEGDGLGYTQRSGIGFQDVPSTFHDRASSIYIPSGWSVKLYEHSDHGGGWACRNASDDTFWSDTYNNNVSLNDTVSSFEVFGAQNCQAPNNAPRAPTLATPGNGSISYTNAPLMCWQNNGDPDGDSVDFRVEVEGHSTATSSWLTTGPYCLTFSSLNQQYGNYTWKVRARDSRGAEAISGTWSFSIQPPPNSPPSITFNTANGSSSSRINSRDQNWTFQGTASDPEGQLSRVEARCEGDGCGSQPAATSSTSWSLQRSDMDGRNDVWFEAVDNAGARTASRHVDLWIDRAPPETRAAVNGSFTIQPWYQGAVQVQLQAEDRGTGRALTEVKRIEYQVDSGAWQSQATANASFPVSGDGEHRVFYRAVDNVDNVEATRGPLVFRIDQTPPTPPSAAAVNCAAVSNQWQNVCATPTFTWLASNDATSGVAGYNVEFVNAQNVVMANPYLLANNRQFSPGSLPTGSYTLRGQTRDVAGNLSTWVTMFAFRYDGTAPNNPSNVAHAAGITSDIWQRVANVPSFTWATPVDVGSGIKGYDVVWGTNPAATATTFQTANSFQSATPLCAANAACVGYLRLRSVDNVNNVAALGTAFVLRYDNAPPAANFTINQGVTQTTQTQVQLNIASTDIGSGLTAMRISGDGYDWTAWEPYATERTWSIPAISRQQWPVYFQVRDGVGLESTVVSRTIYLDVNAQQPHSLNFRLFNHVLSAGAGAHMSSSYRGRSTVGQPADAGRSASASYTLRGGYEAASQAIPLIVPGFERYQYINGIVAAGSVTPKLRSSAYQMQATFGEPALPNNTTTIASSGFSHQPGFLATLRWEDQTPARFRVTINEFLATPISGTEFIELYNAGPDPAVLTGWKIDDVLAGGGTALTIPAGTTIPANGFWVLPTTSYLDASNDAVNLIDATGAVTDTHAYSTASVGRSISRLPDGSGAWVNNTPPTRNAANQPPPACEFPRISINNAAVFTSSPEVTLSICAPDMVEMMLSNDGGFVGAQWETYAQTRTWTLTTFGQSVLPRYVYAVFRDANGTIYSTYFDDIIYDPTAPQGTVTVGDGAPGAQKTIIARSAPGSTVDVQLNAQDDNSGMAQMQISASAAFTDTVWQPFSAQHAWVPTGEDGLKTIYVRFRDHAGNTSPVVSSTFMLDTQVPVGGIVFDQRVVSGEALTQTLYLGAGDANDVTAMRLSFNASFADAIWRPYTTTTIVPLITQPEGEYAIYAQYQDEAGNISEVYSDTYMVDTTPPEVFVSAEESDSLTRPLSILAYDELADLGAMRLSNDPLMLESVVTLSYTPTLTWTFDDRRVVWVQVADSVGNWNAPYPAYAEQQVVLNRRIYLPLLKR